MPYNQCGTKAIEAKKRLLLAYRIRFLFSTLNKNKKKQLPLSRAGSLTHTYALSATIFNIKMLHCCNLCQLKVSELVLVYFLYQTFRLLINCHVQNVIFLFVFFPASNWTSNVCDILYAFLFDVCNLRLGYLMILCI